MTLRTLLLAPLLLVSACGGDGVTLRGTLRPDALSGSDSLSVLAGDGSEPVEVREGAFEVSGVPPGAVTLRFARGGDTTRMEIGGLPEEGEVELRAIRLDDGSGLAFPSAVAVPGGGVVTVNGLRYGGRLPERVAADGTVLAASDDADAFLVRPVDTRLPDLRVVVGPLTQSVTPDGDP
ncbi:MAG TPA: hypothetical protein VHG28_07605, partial [Longimicrobiaceae bacterium]|nr:hypothetical protein [Longimicrobiaceae bacterium]